MLFVVVYLSALLSAPDISPFCSFRVSPSSSGLIQLSSLFCCLEAVTRKLRMIYWESSRKNTLVRCVPEKGMWKTRDSFFCGKPTVSGEMPPIESKTKNWLETGVRGKWRTYSNQNSEVPAHIDLHQEVAWDCDSLIFGSTNILILIYLTFGSDLEFGI